MTHDPLCPYGQAFGHLEPWEPTFYCCQDCNPGMADPDTITCQCDLIAKVRADERRWVLKKSAEQLRSHVVKGGVCACGGAVDDQLKHSVDIVEYYMMTLKPQNKVIDW